MLILFFSFNDDNGIDNNSANSRDALLEESKPNVKRRCSNASQSSHEFSDNEKNKEKRPNKSKNTEDPFNSGSVVGIDWLFESNDCPVESWTSKSKFSVTKTFLDESKKRSFGQVISRCMQAIHTVTFF